MYPALLINQLQEGEAGMLTVSGADESLTALRRRCMVRST